MVNDATHLLISFTNTTPGAPSLALFDVATRAVRIPSVPPQLAIQKVAGVAISEQFLFVVTSRQDPAAQPSVDPPNPSSLFVFDRGDLTLRSAHVCASVFDAHTILAGNNSIHVVSTGSDEVVCMTLREGHVVHEEIVWRPDPSGPRADVHHLNAIGLWRGEMIVSGFGRKSGSTWASAIQGFVASIESGRRIAAELKHPHSLLDFDGTLVYCESSTASVHVLGSDRVQQLPGYARGLARIGGEVFVGVSRGRRVSKSTGLLTNRGDPGDSSGRCGLVRLAAATMQIEETIDLDRFGAEVYDLLPLSGVDGWPVQSETEWRDKFIAGLWADYERRDAHVARLHTEVAERDSTVAWLHREVAARDATVAWLHREIAERDRLLEGIRAPVLPRLEEMK